jgi:hypothetical protein
MTQLNKFEDLNGRFTSSGTGMTQPDKFRDRPGWHSQTSLEIADGLYSFIFFIYQEMLSNGLSKQFRLSR